MLVADRVRNSRRRMVPEHTRTCLVLKGEDNSANPAFARRSTPLQVQSRNEREVSMWEPYHLEYFPGSGSY